MFTPVFHAFFLALGLILPLGVQNVFVFNQGATQPKFRSALPVALTASICDTLLIALAIMGVSVLILSAPLVKTILLVVGVLFLFYMGFATWRSSGGGGGEAARAASRLTPRKQVAYALSVSLLNPHAIMDTVGVIGTSSLQYTGASKLMFGLTCVCVSWLWFFSLAYAGKIVGSLDKSGKILVYLNKASAIIIWASAVALIFVLGNE